MAILGFLEWAHFRIARCTSPQALLSQSRFDSRSRIRASVKRLLRFGK